MERSFLELRKSKNQSMLVYHRSLARTLQTIKIYRKLSNFFSEGIVESQIDQIEKEPEKKGKKKKEIGMIV